MAHIPELDRIVESAMDEQNLSGSVLLVSKGEKIVHHNAYGYAKQYGFDGSLLKHKQPMKREHIFDLASLTKAYATTFAIMLLVDRGELSLDDRITDHLPDFPEDKKDILVRHLLTHTSGLLPWQPIYLFTNNPNTARKWVAGSKLHSPPGKKRVYSDLGFITLGYLIEEISGQPVDQFLSGHLYKPIGLENTMFNPPISDNIVSTSHGNPFERRMIDDDDFGYKVDATSDEMDDWREYVLKGETNDGNSWYAHQGIAGHAGLFSSANDLYVLSRLILNDGRHNRERIISSNTLQSFMQEDLFGNAMGWIKDKSTLNTDKAPPGTMGHTGFTGTSSVIIPEHDIVVILLTNRQHGFPEGNYPNISDLRGHILETVLKFED
ncbi:MAG: serine hydrolase [Balneolales bacterium]